LIECPQCEHLNETFFTFCLVCGSNIGDVTPVAVGPTRAAEPEPEPEAEEVVAETPTLASEPTPEPQLDAEPEPEPEPEPAEDDAPLAEPEAIQVGELADDQTEAEAESDSSDGPEADVESGEQPAWADESDKSAASPTQPCPSCGTDVGTGHTFCGQCGHSFEAQKPAAERIAGDDEGRTEGSIDLIIIDDDGTDAEIVTLFEGPNTVGRDDADIVFEEDVFMDSCHVELLVDGDVLMAADQNSLNGTYFRIHEPITLEHGDTLRLGQELLRYEEFGRVEPSVAKPDDGTELIGAPVRSDVWGRLVQVMSPDLVGNAWSLSGDVVSVGRDEGDITFPGDGYVSGRHATITRSGGTTLFEDLGSSNGTYVRIKEAILVEDGDLLLIGQQLLRVEFPAED
jgi:pSer/pThr/pTyr-binding forkhead associated (FHA) protein